MVKVSKMRLPAWIKCVSAYYHEQDAFHIMKIQLMYDNAPIISKRYQVVTFKFLSREELSRCINELKAAMGVKYLSEIRDNKVYVMLYGEKEAKPITNAELISISIGPDGERSWYPVGIGISGELKERQTIFLYE